jgi:YD repeat-containing protein
MTAQYDPDWKLPTVMADAESNRVETVYTNGSPIRIRQFYSDTQSYDTAFGYYTNGLLAAATNANGHVTEYTYDANGCLATVAAELGPVVSNTCNSLGYVTRTELLAQDGSSSGRVTDFDPDAKGRVRRIDYADGTYATFAYNAIDYLTNTVDRAGHATDYTYAPTEKLTSVTRWLEQDGSNIPVRISYDYDQQFNTLFITEPRGRYVESYQLDVQDRITAVTNIEGQAMSIDYGVGDFVKKITRFDGSSITNTYDTVGRKETVSYLAPNNQQLSTINYTYYADSRPKTVSNSTTSVSNTYDRLNRLTAVRSQRTDVSVAGSTLNYGYDPVGNVTNATLTTDNDSQITSSYTYDSAERLTGISQSGSGILPLAFSYIYSPVNGRISSITNLESGIVTSYAYDIMDRATNIAYRTASGSLIRSLDYQYDALGMITNKTVSGGASSTSTAYQYDSINRLTSESLITDNGSQITGYAYDLAGNRTSVVSPTNQSQITNNYALGAGNRLAFWGATVPPSTTPPATPPTSFPAAERSGRCSGTNATASHLFYPRHPQFNTPTMSWAAPCA